MKATHPSMSVSQQQRLAQLNMLAKERSLTLPEQAEQEALVENLCLACSSCNSHKHIRTVSSDLDTGNTVSLFHPREECWSDHFA